MGRKKKELLVGFLGGLNMSARIIDVMQIEMIKKIRDEKQYKEFGYERWEDFCKDVLDHSDDWVSQRIKTIEELGSGLTSILLKSNLDWKDIRLIPHALDEEQKRQIKKEEIIEIDGKKIPINEENKTAIVTAIKLLNERASVAQKEVNRIKTTIVGLEKEHEKDKRSLESEIAKRQAQIDSMTSPRAMLDVISNLDRIFMEFERTMQFVFSPELHEDLPTQGKIITIIDDMKSRIMRLDQRLDAFLAAENTEK